MEDKKFYSWESEEEATDADLSSVANVMVGFIACLALLAAGIVALVAA